MLPWETFINRGFCHVTAAIAPDEKVSVTLSTAVACQRSRPVLSFPSYPTLSSSALACLVIYYWALLCVRLHVADKLVVSVRVRAVPTIHNGLITSQHCVLPHVADKLVVSVRVRAVPPIHNGLIPAQAQLEIGQNTGSNFICKIQWNHIFLNRIFKPNCVHIYTTYHISSSIGIKMWFHNSDLYGQKNEKNLTQYFGHLLRSLTVSTPLWTGSFVKKTVQLQPPKGPPTMTGHLFCKATFRWTVCVNSY